jgi:HPt (histidine-containing phosphotransfer) domain-containing protein
MPRDREQCLAARMDDYLTKPLLAEDLDQVLARWLGLRWADARPAARRGLQLAPRAAERIDARPDGAQPASPGIILAPAALERIRALQRPGFPDVLERFLDLFIDGSIGAVDSLEIAARGGDAEAAMRIAHTYKSSSGDIGATTLARSFAAMETDACAGRLGDVLRAIPSLRSEHEATLAALRVLRSS